MNPDPRARVRPWRALVQYGQDLERVRRAVVSSQQAVATARTNLENARGNLEDAKRIAAKAKPGSK